jgi:acyl-coenzyme A synthetase/AMP-(fatty) acid ligase
MSFGRPPQYSAAVLSEASMQKRTRLGVCRGCLSRRQLRTVEFLQELPRTRAMRWQSRRLCGACTAVALSNEADLEIPY